MTSIRTASILALVVAILGASAVAAQQAATPAEQVPSAMIVMDCPERFGDLERPPVYFNHARHTAALGADQCTKCHLINEGVLNPSFAAAANDLDSGPLMDAYHDRCRGCHEERLSQGLDSGPLTCGECHRRDNAVLPDQAPMAYDYSLHARHVAVFKDEKEPCRSCHHVWDEELKQLVYVKEREDACSACHHDQDEGKTLSLKNASHVQCLSCHLERTGSGKEAGPSACVGCHDPAHREAVKKLDVIPRLMRGQPDQMWVHRPDGVSQLVAFDHKAHEPRTTFCTSCHHENLQPCRDCHTVGGSVEGGNITLEQAYHAAGSQWSCIGCHRVAQKTSGCVGCHGGMPATSGGSACARCHAGPSPAPENSMPVAVSNTTELAVLPASSDDFPETLVIDVMSSIYEGSKMPHRKIVARLDKATRESRLASVLHRDVETGCEGCHHNSPDAERPPPCRACHGEVAQAKLDRPGLKVAYHRQCIGCHQRMSIDKQGCTDCHAVKEMPS